MGDEGSRIEVYTELIVETMVLAKAGIGGSMIEKRILKMVIAAASMVGIIRDDTYNLSRDLEALTAKVDAIYKSLPGNQPTDATDGKEGWCDICGRSFSGTRCDYCGAHHGPDDDD